MAFRHHKARLQRSFFFLVPSHEYRTKSTRQIRDNAACRSCLDARVVLRLMTRLQRQMASERCVNAHVRRGPRYSLRDM